jgi:hypothetical protein
VDDAQNPTTYDANDRNECEDTQYPTEVFSYDFDGTLTEQKRCQEPNRITG